MESLKQPFNHGNESLLPTQLISSINFGTVVYDISVVCQIINILLHYHKNSCYVVANTPKLRKKVPNVITKKEGRFYRAIFTQFGTTSRRKLSLDAKLLYQIKKVYKTSYNFNSRSKVLEYFYCAHL